MSTSAVNKTRRAWPDLTWRGVWALVGAMAATGYGGCSASGDASGSGAVAAAADAQRQQSAPALLLYRRAQTGCRQSHEGGEPDDERAVDAGELDVLDQVAALLEDIEQQDGHSLLALRNTPVLAEGECEQRITRSQTQSLYGSQPETEQTCGARNRVWVCEDQAGLWVVAHAGDPSKAIAHVRVSAADVSYTAVNGLGNASLQSAPVIAGFVKSPEATDIHWAVRQTELCMINVGNRPIWVDSFNDVPKDTTIFDGAGDLFFPRPVPAPSRDAGERASVVVMQRVQFRRPMTSDEAGKVRRANVQNFCEKNFFVPTKVGEQSGMGLVAMDFQPLHADQSVLSVCAGAQPMRSW
jgi:hypothetical protein